MVVLRTTFPIRKLIFHVRSNAIRLGELANQAIDLETYWEQFSNPEGTTSKYIAASVVIQSQQQRGNIHNKKRGGSNFQVLKALTDEHRLSTVEHCHNADN